MNVIFRPLPTLVVAGLVLAILMGFLASCSTSPAQPAPVAPVATSSTAGHVSDQQFADRFNSILARYPNTKPITAANAPLVAQLACQPGNIYQSLLPAVGWKQVQALLASSARCGK